MEIELAKRRIATNPPCVKFCVVSHAKGGLEEWGEIFFANKVTYCARHGYTFEGRALSLGRNFPAQWQKILLCRELLAEFDRVFSPFSCPKIFLRSPFAFFAPLR